MIQKRNIRLFAITSLMVISILLQVSCSRIGTSVDPGLWGYDRLVTYDALGGSINTREVRETFYLDNSYIFEPTGTTNMLIKPVKDGFILAGWYTAKEDVRDANNQVVGYSFKQEDRWDFDEDRVQEDMTLYARWIPQGKVEYTDAATDEVKFSKNITNDSPIQKLSTAAERLIIPTGHTLFGYFSDKACTDPYDFSTYQHAEPIPDSMMILAQLSEEFPETVVPFDYVEPTDDEKEADDQSLEKRDLYMNKLGYDINTDDETVRAQIQARKDAIIEQAIAYYMENTSEKVVYVKFIKGRFMHVSSLDDLKRSNTYAFRGLDTNGLAIDGYILENDIDFDKKTMELVDSFSGTIHGNGYRLKNIEIKVSSRKVDVDTEKKAGLFLSMDGARIENVIFENLKITMSVNSEIDVTIGALAVNATNSVLENVHFDGMTITTGKGDDGKATYEIHDLIANQTNCELNNVTGERVQIEASDFARVHSLFYVKPPTVDLPVEDPTVIDAPVTGSPVPEPTAPVETDAP